MDLLPSSGEIYWGTYSVGSDRAAITMSAKYTYMDLGSIGTTRGGVLQNCRPPPKRNLRITDFADTMTSTFLRDSRFSLNPPLKSAADWYIEILKNAMKITNIWIFYTLL